MKARFLTAAFVAAILCTGAVRLSAQTASTLRDEFFLLKMLGQDYRNANDRDQAAKQALSAATYDADHDGRLNEKEFAAWQKRVRSFVEQQPSLVRKFDL